MVFVRLHGLGMALGFVSVLDFFGDFVSSNTGETGKPELKPFLTILGTGMRATLTQVSVLPQNVVESLSS
jgi:hypothetical protein